MATRISSFHEVTTCLDGVYGGFSDPEIVVPDLVPTKQVVKDLKFLAGYHDIFRGYIPDQQRFEGRDDDTMKGWLRIAETTPGVPSYLDPATDQATYLKQYRSHRLARNILVEVSKVQDVTRTASKLSDVLGTYHETWASLPNQRFLADPPRKLETAITFAGRVLGSKGVKVTGVHFASASQHGWAHIWRER